ncbi:peptide-N(4)-(N-acetyl-beta-glucosaminyl)asparagine amidase [Tribolium castaneum]|uniref:Peptide-N(4)-(N-acetyl-beta-glucosaminyl)asparagine amidase n=1 Tax=Tribolium castaneum TaxID=7070 RepID=A0A139WEQ5_TRICA|nr:PREDICTED: peptide-N(4)-(N-acetyl-beta-glucosaminyl)asparagine amidase isoform X1 [Tribolium castaneum]KYB26414.1 Peptide-N(4)-(N-acetyl-beta-glucosaminyl)asparagine amidase-like Protein [Tribolium castaneum]|eukprot:XP_008195897.1 PREDICTED: peptide-N(4)-(N-acetyl-beta-glucosaminyl)asparagine amidase isoform X1 [Tribolium castaneum]
MSAEEVFSKLRSNSEQNCDEAVRLLVKIAENIVKDPANLKVRSLQKSNSTIKNKILSVKGGSECLKLMGFQENESSFTLPSTTSMEKLQEVKKCLLNFKNDEKRQGAVPKLKQETMIRSNSTNFEVNGDDLDNVKRFVLPTLKKLFTNPFLQRIETEFHRALAFDDKECQKRAKKLIPLDRLEKNAQRNLRYVQTRIKNERVQDPEFSVQDMLLIELLKWFKEEFFSWVDSPGCEKCGGNTAMSHMSSDKTDLVYTSRVEVYKCKTCNAFTKFPRFNDLNILLETRRGRCGEWANVFTLLCRSLGWDARYVVDELDHVWTEVYSVTQKRWVHCDCCENACDTPLMYETGWNKKLTYIIAYSPDEVQDVTWRYSSNHREVRTRRNKCSEDELVNALITLRNERQKSFSAPKRDYLTKRLVTELIELMVERKANDSEKFGRISGSKEWRSARGEIKNENMYVWIVPSKHIVNNKLTIKYSTAFDKYEFVKGDNSVLGVNGWQYGVYDFSNVFRKEEKDWKTVYLARNEGTDQGSISWRFELDKGVKKCIDNLSLKFNYQLYESGVVQIQLISDDKCVDFPKTEGALETQAFSGVRHFTIKATLSGGKGNVAWQHAQLFRQSSDSKDFPFVLSVTFRNVE